VSSQEIQPATSGKEAPSRGGNERVLLVEDEPGVRLLTRMVLERAGYQVIEAKNGADGLRAWHAYNGQIDVVFTDVVMPDGMNGRELADKLRGMRPDLRVIFTSGYTSDFAGRELSLADRQSFLQKPATPKEMLDALRRALDR
jgi:two-component system cell cycle sensor histidine kinase/response regulator CckA